VFKIEKYRVVANTGGLKPGVLIEKGERKGTGKFPGRS